MATYNTVATLFKAIADAIRSKKGTTDTINAQTFPDEVAGLASLGASATLLFSDSSTSQSVGDVTLSGAVVADYDYIAVVMTDTKNNLNDLIIIGTDTYAKNYGNDNNGIWLVAGNQVLLNSSGVFQNKMTARNLYRTYSTSTNKISYTSCRAIPYGSTYKGYCLIKRMYGIKGDLLNLGG